MTDEYMEKYRKQMDKVVLSEYADQKILDDLLKFDARKGEPYKKRAKRKMRTVMVAAMITIVCVATACTGVAIHKIIIKSNKAESQIEGVGSMVNVGESYYYDLLAGSAGEIYALTDSDYNSTLTDYHAIAWKSTDQGDTWETVLFQPDELNEESGLFAGDLREGEAGIEAIVIIEEKDDKSEEGYVNRVYQITADSYVEYDMDEVYTRLGGQDNLIQVKYVNDHIVAMMGPEECLLYDTDTQEVVKSLPYDLSVACLRTQDQFLIYGKEIYSCLDVETLEEQEPEPELQEFVQMMYHENGDKIMPPMTALDDTIVCITKMNIYEYKDGETTLIRQHSGAVNNGDFLNGFWPICKARSGEYYICAFGQTGMSLWQIDGDGEEIKH